METPGMIRLIVESRIENTSLIGSAVRGIADMLAMDTISSYHVELCVVEAVTNVMKHAYHSEAGHSVKVDMLIAHDRLIFKVYDSGESMDLSRVVPLSFDPLNVESLPEGGMGVFILQTLMDEISYEVINGQNVLTMSKYLSPKKPLL